jgi:hypothetical protein
MRRTNKPGPTNLMYAPPRDVHKKNPGRVGRRTSTDQGFYSLMVAPPEVPRNAEGAQCEGRAKGRSKKRAAKDSIKAGAPAFGCTVHPLRLQAPRAAYAHKSPGQLQV